MSCVLALSFHPAFYPPKSGGEERLYNIYNNLSRHLKVKLITFTYPNADNSVERVSHNENFIEIRIPKTIVSAVFHHFINRCSDIKECSAVVTSIESRFNRNFKKVIADEIRNAETVIFVYPFLYTVPGQLLKGKKIIYESHNIEYELMKESFSDSFLGKILLSYVFHMEKSLSAESNYIFAVSEENKAKFSSLYGIGKGKVYVSPNGVNPEVYNGFFKEKSSLNNSRICTFIGSYHPPNIEAIENMSKFACKMPDTFFLVAGNVSQYFVNSDLVEKTDLELRNIFSRQKVALADGFYGVEYWESVPTIWCRPEFTINFSQTVESAELKIYSPESKDLKIKIEGKQESFKLIAGWNRVKIEDLKNKDSSILFECEPFKNDARTLGVAIQEINYSEGGNTFNFDLNQGPDQRYALKKAKNVILLGRVSDEEKQALFRVADVALNPMSSGSGTNIKMLDYMAAGLPVISTPAGARGLDLKNYENAIICEIPEFPAKIKQIFNDSELHAKISRNGRRTIEERFDWKKIASEMVKVLEEK
ncbi:glycosyltransferase [Methanosarcina hadiensis]|uniref:glycosyltransferase n=1 Tax=Methanosarcina hadiensis TaxID=3078083 RepID=UPI003977956C